MISLPIYIMLVLIIGVGVMVFCDELFHKEYRSIANLVVCGVIVTIAIVLLCVMFCNPLPQTLGEVVRI